MALPLAVIERVMRNAGADSITEDAVRTMRDSVQGIAEEVGEDARRTAQRDDRGTVTVEDVETALEP